MTRLKTLIKKSLTFDYLILLAAGILFLIALRIFVGERFKSLLAIIAFTSFYILWGIYHHSKEDHLHLKNVLEYILIGFTILFFLILIFTS